MQQSLNFHQTAVARVTLMLLGATSNKLPQPSEFVFLALQTLTYTVQFLPTVLHKIRFPITIQELNITWASMLQHAFLSLPKHAEPSTSSKSRLNDAALHGPVAGAPRARVRDGAQEGPQGKPVADDHHPIALHEPPQSPPRLPPPQS
eukprot:CAMPEP_0194547658 /NCGR_PEP_ID=MMETSP0253-20130528/92444_1 /TAXON_ID=2966 /ORGANISM="Noctiluca scintillans" /LENGTH=147 /DNA_ID=CAMNT_0039394891 /DNA_START=127 /DNA_END=566 /DNA_ORIENTATION=+